MAASSRWKGSIPFPGYMKRISASAQLFAKGVYLREPGPLHTKYVGVNKERVTVGVGAGLFKGVIMPNEPWFLISAQENEMPQLVAELPLEHGNTYVLLDYDGAEIKEKGIVVRYKLVATGEV